MLISLNDRDSSSNRKNTPLILVADDDDIFRETLCHVFEKDGYLVEGAADGDAALSAFERLRPDIVLLDINMPRMDGISVCARLQEIFPDSDRIPVLMITGFDDDDSINRSFVAGATDCITKPINLTVLGQRVRRLLRARQAEDELRESEARFRTLFETAPEVIYNLSAKDGTLTLLNPAFETVTGWSRSEWLGRSRLWYTRMTCPSLQTDFAGAYAASQYHQPRYAFAPSQASI